MKWEYVDKSKNLNFDYRIEDMVQQYIWNGYRSIDSFEINSMFNDEFKDFYEIHPIIKNKFKCDDIKQALIQAKEFFIKKIEEKILMVKLEDEKPKNKLKKMLNLIFEDLGETYMVSTDFKLHNFEELVCLEFKAEGFGKHYLWGKNESFFIYKINEAEKIYEKSIFDEEHPFGTIFYKEYVENFLNINKNNLKNDQKLLILREKYLNEIINKKNVKNIER